MLEEYPDGRIIMIGPNAPKYAHKKVSIDYSQSYIQHIMTKVLSEYVNVT